PFSRPPTIRIGQRFGGGRRGPAPFGGLPPGLPPRPPGGRLAAPPRGESSRVERRGGRVWSPSARGERGPRSSHCLRAPYGFDAVRASTSRRGRRAGRASPPSVLGGRGARGPRSSHSLRAPYGFDAVRASPSRAGRRAGRVSPPSVLGGRDARGPRSSRS